MKSTNERMMALTVDVEQPYTKVEYGTHAILNMFDQYEVRATFFIVGDIAEKFPTLVSEIADRGHEIGFHGAKHIPISKISYRDFKQQLQLGKQKLEDITSQQVYGYRAPYFSLQRKTLWAFDALVSTNFTYDSSVYPGIHLKHGWYGAPKRPVKIADNNLIVFPVPMMSKYLLFAFSGGGFLALFPKPLINLGVKLNYKSDHPGMVYIHPWQMIDHHRFDSKLSYRWKLDKPRDLFLNFLGRDKADERLQHVLNIWPGSFGSMIETLNSLHNIPEWNPNGI